MKKIFDNKISKFIVSTIKFVFIAIIVIYIGFTAMQRLSGNKSIFGWRVFTVATGSMIGVYDINDVIAVKDFDSNKLKVGDDIAYLGTRGGLEGLIVTHRIIKVEDTENGKVFVTKGVNSNNSDPSITSSQILGKVTGKIPIVTQINHIIKTQVGFFSLVFCPLVLIIVLEVLQTITDYQVEKEEIRRIEKNSNICEEIEIL